LQKEDGEDWKEIAEISHTDELWVDFVITSFSGYNVLKCMTLKALFFSLF